MQVARRYSDAVAARDYEAAAALLDPAVRIVPPSGRAFDLAKLRAAWAGPGFDHLDVSLEGREFEADGDDEAVMRARQVYRWKEDGSVAYVRGQTTRYRVRGGRIVSMVTTIEGDASDG